MKKMANTMTARMIVKVPSSQRVFGDNVIESGGTEHSFGFNRLHSGSGMVEFCYGVVLIMM